MKNFNKIIEEICEELRIKYTYLADKWIYHLEYKDKNKYMQVIAFIILGISSYAYGTSYMFLPIFVFAILGYLIYKKEITVKRAIEYVGIVFLICVPLILYVIINTFDLKQINILGITIPRMMSNRYDEVATVFSGNLYENCINNR